MESLKLPNMYMTDLGSVYNHLESGAMQIIYGVRFAHLAGLYDRGKEDDFIVNIPVNNYGETVIKNISLFYAVHVDWIMVNARILECLLDETITRTFIEEESIDEILDRCDIIENGEVLPQYCFNSLNRSDLDNVRYAVPIHKVDWSEKS